MRQPIDQRRLDRHRMLISAFALFGGVWLLTMMIPGSFRQDGAWLAQGFLLALLPVGAIILGLISMFAPPRPAGEGTAALRQRFLVPLAGLLGVISMVIALLWLVRQFALAGA